MKKIAFVANGQVDSLVWLKEALLAYERVVAVDGGLKYCDEIGVRPEKIVGDFDSCSEELLEKYGDVPKLRLERDKDETDLEAAVKAEGEFRGTLFGAWGKRLDHSLANLMLLARYPGVLSLETERESVVGIVGKKELKCFVGQTLSLIPVGKAEGIKTNGLKWELKGEKIMDQNFLGISNICLRERVEIEVGAGVLVCSMLRRGAVSA